MSAPLYWIPAGLCFAYGAWILIRYGRRLSLFWGWLVAAAYFGAAAFLPPPWSVPAAAPPALTALLFLWFLTGSRGADGEDGDVCLILGCRTDGGLPRRLLPGRAEKAAALYRRRPVKMILIGGAVGRETEPEARTLRRLLRERGVPDGEMQTEEASRETGENLAAAAQLLAPFQKVTVVTDAFHRRRVLALARKALPGKILFFAPAGTKTGLLTLHLLVREFFTYLVDLVRGRACSISGGKPGKRG